MDVSAWMTTDVKCCGPMDTAQQAAKIMWEHDCGVVPIVDSDRRVVGIITDRDLCMAAYTQGVPLSQLPLAGVMSRRVRAVRECDPVDYAEELMRRYRIRRLPVLDADGRLLGLLSLNDVARHTLEDQGRREDSVGCRDLARTLAAIGDHRTFAVETAPEPDPVWLNFGRP